MTEPDVDALMAAEVERQTADRADQIRMQGDGPDTPQPQDQETATETRWEPDGLRDNVAMKIAMSSSSKAAADLVIPLVAKAQREADVARAKTHHWSYAVVDDLITAPLISEEATP